MTRFVVWVRRRFGGRRGRVTRGRAKRDDDGYRRRTGVTRRVVEMIRRARVLYFRRGTCLASENRGAFSRCFRRVLISSSLVSV